MKCEKIEEVLSSFLDGDLSPEEKNAVEEHLKTCAKCSLLYSFMEEIKESLADFPEVNISENLFDRLHSIPTQKKKSRLSLDFFLRPSLQPVLTGATILLTLLSFYIFNPNRNRIDKSINRQIHLGYSKIERLYAKADSLKDSLGEYKDSLLVSVKKINIFGESEE